MASSIYDWSQTASDNDDIDSAIAWSNTMAPDFVDDSARAMMARIAELVGDIGGSLAAGGTADALTVTANSSFSSYSSGMVVAFKAASTNTTAATLNVNSIGAKSIRKDGDDALVAGDIQDDGVYVARYDTGADGGSGGWVLQNPATSVLPDRLGAISTAVTDWDDAVENGWFSSLNDVAHVPTAGGTGWVGLTRAYSSSFIDQELRQFAADIADTVTWYRQKRNGVWSEFIGTPVSPGFPSGTLMLFQQTSAPTGWTKQTTHNNKALRVVSGAASSGGSVAFTAAFASQSVAGTIASTTATGTVGGTAITTAQMPAHTHGAGTLAAGSAGAHSHTLALGGTGGAAGENRLNLIPSDGDQTLVWSNVGSVSIPAPAVTDTEAAHTHTITGSIDSEGSGSTHTHTFTGSAHDHTFTGTAINLAVQYVDLIIASKD